MINDLSRLVDYVEGNLCGEIDITVVARSSGVTGYHLRRMFSSLAGMPLSEYVRRRRMTVAAGDVLAGDDLLSIAVRYGYGSAEAFGRAFRTVHGIGPTEARRTGGPLRTQQQLRFRLTVEGSSRMDARIVNRPTILLVGHATRVPLIYEGVNPHIAEFTESLPAEVHSRLYALGDTHEEGPGGLLAVNDDVAPDSDEGAELTYMHGVAVTGDSVAPDDLDVITVPAGDWVVFRSSGAFPESLQTMWAATATEWFPSNPWQLRPGPSLVSTLEHDEDFTTATCELWFPVEPREA
ncbi:AraC family transcriptional regulator [Corynebacterium sp.]|uniref:AraC family transcriptional regulator n=1 Tax=Corynebacterium sp. TaxID=1720 RepID=UPI0028A9DBE9|nr:AraC family transcriptional regulator [Corynebacterium sp.]